MQSTTVTIKEVYDDYLGIVPVQAIANGQELRCHPFHQQDVEYYDNGTYKCGVDPEYYLVGDKRKCRWCGADQVFKPGFFMFREKADSKKGIIVGIWLSECSDSRTQTSCIKTWRKKCEQKLRDRHVQEQAAHEKKIDDKREWKDQTRKDIDDNDL